MISHLNLALISFGRGFTHNIIIVVYYMEEKRKLLEMRKGQAASLQAMISDLTKDGVKLKADNELLLRHKAQLEA